MNRAATKAAGMVDVGDIGKAVSAVGERASSSSPSVMAGVLRGYRYGIDEAGMMAGRIVLAINQGGYGRDHELWCEPDSLIIVREETPNA